MSDFLLIGHDCPLGSYPGPVVPIGECDGKLVAVYASSNGKGVVEIPRDAHFIVHDSDTKESLKEFSYKAQRLFAYAANRVVAYMTSEEHEFFARVLADSMFGIENPFLRLALAKGSRDSDIVLRELIACARKLNATGPELIQGWYENERKSAFDEGIDEQALPKDAAQLLETAGLLLPQMHDQVARLIRCVGGMNVVARPDLPFDLYFEESDQSGRRLRTAVELKFHSRVDEDAIKEVQHMHRMYKDQHIVDQTWLVFGGELTSGAAELANVYHIHLLRLTDLWQRAASMNAFEYFFIDALRATVRVRPWVQLNPHSRYDLMRIFPAAEQDPLAGVTLFAREYLGEILSAAENPSRCILTFDLLGADSDFPDWHDNPLFEARLLANATYADAFRRKFPGQSSGAKRVLVVNPERITREGASYLRAYMLHHLQLGIGIAIMAQGSAKEPGIVQRMAGFARDYEKIWKTSKQFGRGVSTDLYEDLAIHWLWREMALTAGQILGDPMAGFKIENDSDVDRILEALHIPRAPRGGAK